MAGRRVTLAAEVAASTGILPVGRPLPLKDETMVQKRWQTNVAVLVLALLVAGPAQAAAPGEGWELSGWAWLRAQFVAWAEAMGGNAAGPQRDAPAEGAVNPAISPADPASSPTDEIGGCSVPHG